MRCSTSSARSRIRPIRIPAGSVDAGPRPRAAGPRVHARRPRDGRAAAGAAQGQRPARHAGRARGRRARGGRRPAASTRASRPGTPIRDLGLDADESKAIRGFRFLTEKPVLVLLNVGEGRSRGGAGPRRADRGAATPTSTRWSRRCRRGSRWSSASSSPTRPRCSWRSSGIAESGLDRVIALSYRLLGLISFLTAGPDEVRAWPIPDGSTAVDAAGAIHTDLAKGLHPGRDGRLRRPAHARLDGRGAQGRPAPLGGQDLQGPRRRRPRDPVQHADPRRPSRRWRLSSGGRLARVELGVGRRSG